MLHDASPRSSLSTGRLANLQGSQSPFMTLRMRRPTCGIPSMQHTPWTRSSTPEHGKARWAITLISGGWFHSDCSSYGSRFKLQPSPVPTVDSQDRKVILSCLLPDCLSVQLYRLLRRQHQLVEPFVVTINLVLRGWILSLFNTSAGRTEHETLDRFFALARCK